MKKISITKINNQQLKAGMWSGSIAGIWWQVVYPVNCIALLGKFMSTVYWKIKNNVIIKNSNTILFSTFTSACRFVSDSLLYAKIQTSFTTWRATQVN